MKVQWKYNHLLPKSCSKEWWLLFSHSGGLGSQVACSIVYVVCIPLNKTFELFCSSVETAVMFGKDGREEKK